MMDPVANNRMDDSSAPRVVECIAKSLIALPYPVYDCRPCFAAQGKHPWRTGCVLVPPLCYGGELRTAEAAWTGKTHIYHVNVSSGMR